eukprot:5371051-Ditylum_brightwellii.AAC.1
MQGFDTTAEDKDVIELLKEIKSTVFRLDNKCDIYIAMGNIINRFWRFFQPRDVSIISYYKKYKNLIEVAEEHSANLGIHPGLMMQEASDENALTDKEIDTTKSKFFGRMFVMKACRYRYQKLKEELHNGLTQGQNGYPNTVDQAYTMICKGCNQDAPRIETNPQLAFHADGGDPQDREEEILPPTGGGKVRPWVTCDKCKKKGHYANKCP